MQTLVTKFASDMDEVSNFVQLVQDAISLAKVPLAQGVGDPPIVTAAAHVHSSVKSIKNPSVIAFDGTFLYACAVYELFVRELIEKFVASLDTKIHYYNQLPDGIRNSHDEGCAYVMMNISNDSFKHLTRQDVVQHLVSCARSSAKQKYKLLPEVFSYNDRNLRPSELEIVVSRLGLDKFWQKMAREKVAQDYLNVSEHNSVERFLRSKLEEIMVKRNNLIHRGKGYYSPSESDVANCASYFKMLSAAMLGVLSSYYDSL